MTIGRADTMHMALWSTSRIVRCRLQSHNAVVFSATNHDFRLSSRFVGGRGVGRGRERPGSITRGSWAAVCGRADLGRPHRVIRGDERHSERALERGWQRSGIPVSVDLVHDTLGWVRRASSITRRCALRRSEWKTKTRSEYEKKRSSVGHRRRTAFHRDDVSYRPCRNSFKPVTRFTATVYNGIYTLHASVNSNRQRGQEVVYVTWPPSTWCL